MDAELTVECEGHIENRGSRGQSEQFAFRRENNDLGSKEIEFQRIEKVNRTWLGIVENIFDRAQPDIQFRLFVAFTYLVFPVSRKTFLGDLVHAARTDLHLNPVAVRPHHSEMKSLVAVGLWHGYPVACAVRMKFVNIGYR